MRRPITAAVALAALALLASACGGGGSKGGTSDTFVPGGESATTSGSATATTSAGPASRSNPLAQRVFKYTSEPKAGPQKAAVQTLEDYFDGLVKAFATNDVGSTGIHRLVSADLYKQAQDTIAGQVQGGYVLYGPYVFTIDPSDVQANVGVVNVCIDQHATRRHDARTDKAGKLNDTPYVQLDYTLSHATGPWQVTSVKGGKVQSCPA
jgi:hypothetical protein